MTRARRLQFTLRFLLLLMFLSAVAVFFWGRPKPCTVNGSIQFADGKPIGVATVSFHNSAGKTKHVDSDINGKFEMRLLPGTYSLGIQSSALTTQRYSSPQSSGLTVSVVEGTNDFVFVLSP